MPHKHNAERRHHIAKMPFKVTNRSEYEAGLRRRGSLMTWITEAAIGAWNAVPRLTPGEQATYSDGAIQTCLMLRAAFKLPQRQAEGLLTSFIELLGCDLAVPDRVGARIPRRVALRSPEVTSPPLSAMPNKHNADRRHHIPKMKRTVTNWAEYEAGLRRRGSLTMWITEEAIAGWGVPQRSRRGGQAVYSDGAIATCLMLRTAFKLALRQGEGLMKCVVELLGRELKVPDHTTVSRRASALPSISEVHLPDGPLHVLIDSTGLKVYGAGEWFVERHGQRARRSWRKLHLAVDAHSGQIVASVLTGQDVDDPSQVAPLLDQIPQDIEQVTADGAYDGEPTYATVAARSPEIAVVIPQRATSIESAELGANATRREVHVHTVAALGRLGWQEVTGYGKRALVEKAMGRYKSIIGSRLRARTDAGQLTEAFIGVAVLNRMLAAGRPNSVRNLKTAS